MKKLKRVVLIVTLIIFGIVNLIGSSHVYGADKTLKATKFRPYSDDNGESIIGNDYYELQRAARQTVFKIYEKGTNTGTNKFPDAIYCLRGGLGFGDGENGLVEGAEVDYDIIGDMIEDKTLIMTRFQQITGVAISDANYNAILWIIDQMYLPQHKATGETTYVSVKSRAEQAEMKAKLLKAANIEPSLTELTDDDIEVIQQVAIWYFSNFDQNGAANSVSINKAVELLSNLLLINGATGPSVGLTTSRLADIQKLFIYLVNGAIANAGTVTTAPDLSFGNTNPQVTEKTIPPGVPYYIVGPFEIINTGGNDYTFEGTIQYKKNNDMIETITIDNGTGLVFITNADGTDQSRDKELEDMVNGGQFYLAINKALYNDVKDVSIKIKYSYWKTKKATFMDAGEDQQPVVLIEKEKVEEEIEITTEEIEGKFELIIAKTDEGGDIIERVATFTVRKMLPAPSGSTQTFNTTNGMIRIEDIEITYNGEVFVYEIEETIPPIGYNKLVGKFFIRIATEKVEDEYRIKNEGTEIVKLENGVYVPVTIEGLSINVLNDGTTVLLSVENEKKVEGEFELEIRKVNQQGVLILNNAARFTIKRLPNGTVEVYYTTNDNTQNGTVTGIIRKEVLITEDMEVFIYEIEETKAPIGYKGRTGKFYLGVWTEKIGDEYKVVDVRLLEPGDGDLVPVDELEGITLNVLNDNATIQLIVENEEVEEFDLALRKFISKINNKVLTGTESREPEIDISKLRDKTGTTAVYTHPKEPVSVRKGDIVTYTIRVYNEGDIDGYAKEITDYIPEGLGYILDHKTNVENRWSIPVLPAGATLKKLVGENGIYKNINQVRNLTINDFDGITSLEEVSVIAGKVPVTTDMLKRDDSAPGFNLIPAYDRDYYGLPRTEIGFPRSWQETSETGYEDGLYYCEVEIACIVLAEDTYPGIIRNIAEISEAEDGDGNDMNEEGDDRDSTPDNVDIDDYTPPTNNSEYQEDDDDYEQLKLQYFDLALRKFITKVENEDITSRIPRVELKNDGELTYVHTKTPVQVANSQVVTYTIRIYNEGSIAGYAEEIKDNIPEGLEYLPDHGTNKKYEWKMYYKDEDDVLIETNDPSKATEIRTDYLSSAKETGTRQNEIKPFDPTKPISGVAPLNPDYRDVQVAFKVVEPQDKNNSGRIIINTAEISEDSDDDIDSTPDDDDLEEDDIDREYIYVKYFDLELIKWVSRAIVTIDGKTTTTNYEMPADDPGSEFVVKVDIGKDKMNKTTVDFVYTIKVINTGEIEGYATEVTDYIPAGLEFIAEDNPLWDKVGDNKVITRALENTLLKPGESATIDIKLRWKNSGDNVGTKKNIAEISEDYNEYGSKDIDSKPNNQEPKEDDEDFALVMVTIRTGATVAVVYMSSIVMMLTILLSGVFLIKRYVLV